VRTTVDATDSLYLNMLKFGQSLDRPQVVEYKWLSQDFKVPVLQINTTGGFVTSVLVAKVEEEVLPSVCEESESVLAIYPVPALDRISVSHGQPGAPCAIYDLQGQLVWKGILPADTSISVAELSSGSYTLVVSETDRMVPLRFVK
ncbi:MAG: T9SS type A sorting domain-containing protein, partial [Flavobacteriales bacterium]|nr:T9SS type A sorting domain-containing protein [Flavobacteriales bacterium]